MYMLVRYMLRMLAAVFHMSASSLLKSCLECFQSLYERIS